MDIKAALAELDPLNDDQWTAEGAPRIEAISNILGQSVTRKEVTDAAPLFNRANPSLDEVAQGEKEETKKTPDPLLSEEPTDDNREDTPYITEKDYRETSGPVDQSATVEDLRQRQEKMEPILEAMIKAHKQLGDQIAAYTAKLDEVKGHLEIVDPNSSNAEAISDYIKSQNKSREDRLERRNIVLQGLTEKDLRFKSPLDEAFSRKNTRGTARPQR